jgi:phage antirepressor YoqD-like protein
MQINHCDETTAMRFRAMAKALRVKQSELLAWLLDRAEPHLTEAQRETMAGIVRHVGGA